MRPIVLWHGYHRPAMVPEFAAAWKGGKLLIACPPADVDMSFVETLARDWPLTREPPVLGVFTTGTTRGTQKLVLFSRENVLSSQAAILELFDRQRIKTVFCYPQPYHVFGLLLGYALAVERDLRLVTAAGSYSSMAHAAWLAERDEAMLTLATPSHMLDLCTYLERNALPPRPTYTCILGGAKVDRDTWLKARSVARIAAPSIGYGCTEASPGVCHLPPGQEPQQDGEVGYALPSLRMDFANSADFAGAGPRLGYRISGPSVALATVEAGVLTFMDTHHVADELCPLADGRFAFLGRQDLLLNRGGEKFPLEHIEALLKSAHGVDAVCVAVPDSRLGEELGILARLSAGESPDATISAIYETLSANYRRSFNRRNLRFVAELPLNLNAKLDRKLAAQLVLADAVPAHG